MALNLASRLLTFVVCTCITFEPLIYARNFAQAGTRETAEQELHKAVVNSVLDPVFVKFTEGLGSEIDIPTLSPDDLSLDQNPFFMTGQRWEADVTAKELSYVSTANAVSIRVPSSKQKITIPAPLHPIYANESYIFFALNPASQLFKQKTEAGQEVGEGLFVVHYNDLLSASLSGHQVPVFFFPTPGTGWQATNTKDITVHEVPQYGQIIFKNTANESLSVLVDDINGILKIESWNLYFAQLMGYEKVADRLEHEPQLLNGLKDRAAQLRATQQKQDPAQFVQTLMAEMEIVTGRALELPKGSTAGFGLFFSGLDLSSGKSVFAQNSSKWYDRLLSVMGLNKAFAAGTPEAAIARFTWRTIRMLGICGAAYVAGVGLRYLPERYGGYRGTMDKRLGGPGIKSHLKQSIDIYAHSMTVMSQFPSVWPTNVTEYVMDRGGITPNSLARKFFNSSFGYARQTSNRTPVNAKTVGYGVGVLGTIDTGLVAFQWYLMFGWVGKVMKVAAYALTPPPVAEALASRIDAAYETNDPAMAIYNMLSVLGNMTAYITSGAYSYAHEMQDIATNQLQNVVAEEMRREGIDPDRHKTEYGRRLDQRVRAELKSQGLPGDEQFLFDANSLWSSLTAFFGYEAPDGKDPSHYPGVARFGLLPAALNRAVDRAEAKGAEGAEAAGILKEVQQRMNRLYHVKNNPQPLLTKEGLRFFANEYRAVRRELVSLTYDGSISDGQLPETWVQGRSIVAVRTAAEFFRIEFQAGITGDQKVEVKTGPVELDPMITEGFFARWQMRRALTKANERLVEQAHVSMEVALQSPEHQDLWERLFQAELLRVANIVPDWNNEDLIQKVETDVKEEFQSRLSNDGALADYLSKLAPLEKRRVETIIKSDIFVDKYLSALRNSGQVDPLDPNQTGRFQSLRKILLSRVKTRDLNLLKLTSSSNEGAPIGSSSVADVSNMGLRAIEGFFTDDQHKRGLYAKLARSVPLMDDMITGTKRSFRRIPTSAIFVYPYAKYLWGFALPANAWTLNFILGGPLVSAGWNITNRVMKNLGLKPGSKIASMASFATFGSFMTCWGGFMYGLTHNDYFGLYAKLPTLIQDHGISLGIAAAVTFAVGEKVIGAIGRMKEAKRQEPPLESTTAICGKGLGAAAP